MQDRLEAIAQHFALGVVQNYHAAKGTNQNFFVTTDQGQFLFKIIVNATREEAVEDIETGLPYLNRLAEHDFPIVGYITAPNGSLIYQSAECIAVAMHQLQGHEPEISENVCREIGSHLARLHLIPTSGLAKKRHWLEHEYLLKSIEVAKNKFGTENLKKIFKEFHSLQHFRPDTFPQSIIHGDMDPSNCLFVGDKVSAFLDWQECGMGASLLDFGMTVLGFCFVKDRASSSCMIFHPQAYQALFDGYSQIRPFSPDEKASIESAVKYAGLTLSMWFMLRWNDYFPGEEFVETKLSFWKRGLDIWTLPHSEE